MSSPQINTLSQPARTNSLERIEAPGAALTLTRSGTLAIVTTGTDITWQTTTRSAGISWTTTDITIPTAGYYMIQVAFATSANCTMLTQLVLNTVNIGYFGNTFVASNYHVATNMRYFATGDVIRIRAVPSANVNITVNAETALNASPYLHIVQLTRPVL